MVNEEGRLVWSNAELSARLNPAPHPEYGTPVKDFWPEMILKPIWGMTGEYIFCDKETKYRAEYRPVPLKDGSVLMAFYVTDVTELEQMRAELAAAQLGSLCRGFRRQWRGGALPARTQLRHPGCRWRHRFPRGSDRLARLCDTEP